jgi:antibiotic biosynthesis monooxygenase (ABM) superfamily enzyme
MNSAKARLDSFLAYCEEIREKAKQALLVVSTALVVLGLCFRIVYGPFLEHLPTSLRYSWLGLFLVTLLLTIVSIPRWQCLIGVGSMLMTLLVWISV